jgi:hypothetical protein
MNMPIDEKRQVHFNTTLFALIRESLDVKKRNGNSCRSSSDAQNGVFHLAADERDEADNELREVICNIWPNLAKKQIKLHEGGTKSLLDLVVPPKNGLYSMLVVLFALIQRHSLELHGIPSHRKLTVGKVYAIGLYIDNYRSFKQGRSNNDGVSAVGVLQASESR